MVIFLLQGITFGFAAAAQPGPFQVYLVSQSMTLGWRRAVPAALAPLLTDGPIIALGLLVLDMFPTWLMQLLRVAGGFFLLYLAVQALKNWRGFNAARPWQQLSGSQNLLKAVMVNILNPGPYLFWAFVAGPILLSGWRQAPETAISFLAGFYGTMLLTCTSLVLAFSIPSHGGPKLQQAFIGISALVLAGFGLYQLGLVIDPNSGL